jgi:hypothetical protein
LPERLATSWTPDQRISAENAARLPEAITEIEALNDPIDDKVLAVLLAKSLKLWKLPEDWDDVAPFYREALADVPLDLVQSALKHLRLTLKWFPKPCELRAPIEAELSHRRDLLRRIRTMALKARLGDVEEPVQRLARTPAQEAEAVEIAEKTKLMLSAVQHIPADDTEDPAAGERNRKRRVSLAEAYKVVSEAGIDLEAWRREPKDGEP